ncbi:MAG: hypothetical protein JOZ83_04045, partial [Silvibacterium sp.]|nr:hypothetical protein [Silvibacterium sp.]
TIIHNTYIDRTVIINNVNHVSYNGGQGGITVRPTPEQERVAELRHIPPVAAQQQHMQQARGNPELRATQNQGKPPIAATSRPTEFRGQGVVAAREAGAPYHAPPKEAAAPNHAPAAAALGSGRGGTPASHATDLEPHQVTPPNTGNPKLDMKYQKQQQQLVDKMNKEHEQLQQRQEMEHQQAQQRNFNQEQMQQLEQRHQQQTQEMQQHHTQQIEDLQRRQAPPPPRQK